MPLLPPPSPQTPTPPQTPLPLLPPEPPLRHYHPIPSRPHPCRHRPSIILKALSALPTLLILHFITRSRTHLRYTLQSITTPTLWVDYYHHHNISPSLLLDIFLWVPFIYTILFLQLWVLYLPDAAIERGLTIKLSAAEADREEARARKLKRKREDEKVKTEREEVRRAMRAPLRREEKMGVEEQRMRARRGLGEAVKWFV